MLITNGYHHILALTSVYKTYKYTNYFKNDLQNDTTEPVLDLSLPTQKHEPTAILEDVVGICHQISEAEDSFIRTTFSRIAGKIRNEKSRDASHDETLQHHPPSDVPVTDTERHRIRRALWRLWLYFEIFHSGPGKKSNGRPVFSNFDTLYTYFQTMTVWELEELDCIYHHIKYQSQLWRKQCHHCAGSFLPDEFRGHWCASRPLTQKLARYRSITFELELSNMRKFIKYKDVNSKEEATKWIGSPPAADMKSAGFEYLERDNITVGILYPRWMLTGRSNSLSWFLEWGYCIWDKERMEAWRLVDDPAKGLLARTDLWVDGEMGDKSKRRRWVVRCMWR